MDRITLPIGANLDRFILKNQQAFKYATGELSQLLRDVAYAGKIVNRELNRAGLTDITGRYGEDLRNSSGDDQQKLDVAAHIRFVRALKKGGMY